MTDEALEKSGVSAEVRAEVRKEIGVMKVKLVKLHNEIQELRVTIREEFKKENPSRDVIGKAVEKIADLKREQALAVGKSKAEIMFKLTPEQREKVTKHLRERRREFKKRFHEGRKGRKGKGHKRGAPAMEERGGEWF